MSAYPWLFDDAKRPDLPCTDCGEATWENLYGWFGCTTLGCRRFGEMIPAPAEGQAT